MNIGPGPDGDWDPVAYDRLKQIGNWMKTNGEGIYNSTSVLPYSESNIYYTKSKNTNTIYAFILSDKDKVDLPQNVKLHLKGLPKIKKISLLGSDKKLKWTLTGDGININISTALQANNGLAEAAVFKVQY